MIVVIPEGPAPQPPVVVPPLLVPQPPVAEFLGVQAPVPAPVAQVPAQPPVAEVGAAQQFIPPSLGSAGLADGHSDGRFVPPVLMIVAGLALLLGVAARDQRRRSSQR